MYKLIRKITYIFYFLDGVISAFITLLLFSPFIYVPIADKNALQPSFDLFMTIIVSLILYVAPMFIVAYKIYKNQQIGWIIGIIISLLWLVLRLIIGKNGFAFSFPIFSLMLCSLGLFLKNKHR